MKILDFRTQLNPWKRTVDVIVHVTTRTAATTVERSAILKRYDKGNSPRRISERTGIPLHIVEHTVNNRDTFERRKQVSAYDRDRILQFEEEVWNLIETNPFINLDPRSTRYTELIGQALCGEIKPEEAIEPIEKYLSQYSNTLFYLR